MAAKSSSSDDVRSAVRGIIERGEEVVGVFVDELLSGLHVRDELSRTVRRAAGARKRVEDNFESLLTLLSVPTRSDYKRLLSRIDQLQGSLVNINMKLDRLLAERAAAAPPPRAKAVARRAGKHTAARSR